MTDTNVSGDSGLVLKETIPLWLAVGITVLVALPFTLYSNIFAQVMTGREDGSSIQRGKRTRAREGERERERAHAMERIH